MDPNWPFRRREEGESSRPTGRDDDHMDIPRFGPYRMERVLSRCRVVNMPPSHDPRWTSLPNAYDTQIRRPSAPRPGESRPSTPRPFYCFQLPSEMGEANDDNRPPPRLSTVDAWFADHKAMTRDDIPVYHMHGYRGAMSRNSFRKWTRTSNEPPLQGVRRHEDQRLLPRLDYTLSMYDKHGKRTFIEPILQYDASEEAFFILDWNQSSFEGAAADLLNWPKMFEK
ncbi:hypothetical protein RHMOL_Rhmol01G0252700 [Rhododendron molle]|uniref:Uncharacterized protein n=1 Tax=Rhododendron molle TaxID=49168 RepID=A0ACC0Q535_RHOML|nr:hypothetical protein RHMOL_Rhmol01G0252700 [Rhododendron molle]